MSYNKTLFNVVQQKEISVTKYINNTKCGIVIPLHSSTFIKITCTNHVNSIWQIADVNFLDLIFFFVTEAADSC